MAAWLWRVRRVVAVKVVDIVIGSNKEMNSEGFVLSDVFMFSTENDSNGQDAFGFIDVGGDANSRP